MFSVVWLSKLVVNFVKKSSKFDYKIVNFTYYYDNITYYIADHLKTVRGTILGDIYLFFVIFKILQINIC